MLLQYLKFGFPLSLTSPDQLDNTQVKNHYSATQYPVAIQEYLHKETQLVAILGRTPFVDSKHFHCSPLLTRPKDTHKRRVILNLSHPYGASVNNQVSKSHFDNRKFTLRFPGIDHIVQIILETDDPLMYKIDVARAFRNLRVDPVDVVKFGIHWDNHFYLDQSIAFGWTHGRAAFQMVSGAVMHTSCVKHGHQFLPTSTKFNHSFLWSVYTHIIEGILQKICLLLLELYKCTRTHNYFCRTNKTKPN